MKKLMLLIPIMILLISIVSARTTDDWIMGIDFEDGLNTYAGELTVTNHGASVRTDEAVTGSYGLFCDGTNYIEVFTIGDYTDDIAIFFYFNSSTINDRKLFGSYDSSDDYIWLDDSGATLFTVGGSAYGNPVPFTEDVWSSFIWQLQPNDAKQYIHLDGDLSPVDDSLHGTYPVTLVSTYWCGANSAGSPYQLITGGLDDICIINISAAAGGNLSSADVTYIHTNGCRAYYDSLAVTAPTLSNINCTSNPKGDTQIELSQKSGQANIYLNKSNKITHWICDYSAWGNCRIDGDNKRLICDSNRDGNDDGFCQSGESCYIVYLEKNNLKKIKTIGFHTAIEKYKIECEKQ